MIALWDEAPGQGFPGYAWLFPGLNGLANVGVGLGLGSVRSGASRAVVCFDEMVRHLTRLGLLGGPVDGRRLGGWLKMGIVGTRPARGRVLLVGDAAGMVNPLQGEGIAPAMASGRAAADAVFADPARAAHSYRAWVAATHQPYLSVAAPVHMASISGSPGRVSRLGRRADGPWTESHPRRPVGAVVERPPRRHAAGAPRRARGLRPRHRPRGDVSIGHPPSARPRPRLDGGPEPIFPSAGGIAHADRDNITPSHQYDPAIYASSRDSSRVSNGLLRHDEVDRLLKRRNVARATAPRRGPVRQRDATQGTVTHDPDLGRAKRERTRIRVAGIGSACCVRGRRRCW